MVTQFGAHLGQQIRALLQQNTEMHRAEGKLDTSWVNATCDAIGSEEPGAAPPPSAVAAVKALLIELTAMTMTDAQKAMPSLTDVDAYLLEAWRVAAADPDHQIFPWLRDGAPTGITQDLIDPGIFPACSRPAEVQPENLECNSRQFKNYPGVEENQITDAELASHLEKGHLKAFDTYEELRLYVDAQTPQFSTNWAS